MKVSGIFKRFGVLAALAVFLAPTVSFAATGLSIQPVKVSQTLSPGDSTSGTILLTNASEEDINVDIKIEDFVPVAGAESIQFVGRAQGVTTVRDWLTVNNGSKSFVFKKGQQRVIPYTITAPAGAEPGGHFGVIFFKATKLSDADAQIKVGTQVGVLFLVTIPGNYLQKGEIRNFSAPSFVQTGPVQFNVTFENTGTVHFEPKGEIAITDMFGRKAGSVPIEGQVVLPTGVKDLTFGWNSNILFGKYNAVATVVDGQGTVLTSKQVSFYALPIWYIVLFLIGILVLFIVFKFIRSRVKISVNFK